MPLKVVVPELGESLVDATVGRWLKKEGERVAVGDVLVELETEKVNLEVGAERNGVLARIQRKEGENVRIGDVLAWIEEALPEAQAGARSAAVEAKPPSLAEAKKPAPGAPSAISSRGAGSGAAAPDATHGQPQPGKPAATPLARRVAEVHGVELAKVPASDESGRIRQRDVEAYMKAQSSEAPTLPSKNAEPARTERPAEPAPTPGAENEALPSAGAGRVRREASTTPASAGLPERSRSEERVRMSRRRQTIARRLVEAQRTAAMLTTFNEIDMTAVTEVRERRKAAFKERHGVSLGVTSFFVKAAVSALRHFPRLNAEIQGDEMVIKHFYDVGVAVGAKDGLVVPVLRDADRMSFAQIEIAIKGFAKEAQEGTLTLDDLRGGTFTITNGGVYGSLLSTPILNPPQVGILGLHKIEPRPVSLGGQIVSRAMMYVALSYDHRIVDGMEAVQFLVRVKELVEHPEDLLLED
jgi:2-oxoglutarate dehydrogenase E2 component (dihydrolipoamide succinyltransferase)